MNKNTVINILYYLSLSLLVLAGIYALGRIFVLDRFRVGGHSMEPTLSAGESLWVEKWTMGARLPSLRRLPGLGRLRPGDIAVFNTPEGGAPEGIGFRVNYVYAKRCIGTPGDTVSIRGGFYHNSSLPGRLLCPPEGQARLHGMTQSLAEEAGVFWQALPGTPWNVRDFGPLAVPRKGLTVLLDSVTAVAYAKAVAYESGRRPQAGESYTFRGDWYFFGGDNVLNSRDSRYIGLVPAGYIVGRVLPLGRGARRSRDLRKGDPALEEALAFAGANRGELETVLFRYAGSGEKLDAAEWLIRNMPSHYAYVHSAVIDSIHAVLREIKAGKVVDPERARRWQGFRYETLPKRYDSQVMTADFLIDNIDRAFEARDRRPWNRDLPFEDFCEMMLPYRVGTEALVPWRRQYGDRYGHILDSLYTGRDVVLAVDAVYEALRDSLFRHNADYRMPDPGPDFLMKTRIGSCRESCAFTVYLLRSLGIPVTTDFSRKDAVHSWNTVRDTTGRQEVFWFDNHSGARARRGGEDGRTKGKVYRYLFAPDDGRPYRDVSREYFGATVCTADLPERPSGPVWLGMFTGGRWLPIAAGTRRGRKVTFRDFEPGIVYAPVDRQGREWGTAFIPHADGQVERLIPGEAVARVTTTRKTLLPARMAGLMAMSRGILIEGAETPAFTRVAWRDSLPAPRINYNGLSPGRRMRYLRLRPPQGRPLQLAEIRAFRDAERRDTIPLRIVAASAPDRSDSAEKAVDGDELSFYLSPVPQPFLVLDLGATEYVASIEWVPRNDDNFIRYGDTYELLYHNGAEGWCSLGTQLARDTALHWTGVPDRALLRLHNRTRGREEDAFIVQNGRQRFVSWNML